MSRKKYEKTSLSSSSTQNIKDSKKHLRKKWIETFFRSDAQNQIFFCNRLQQEYTHNFQKNKALTKNILKNISCQNL